MHTGPFADEITQNRPRLQRFARRLIQNQRGAEDLVQETVLRALAHTDHLPPETQLFAWLKSILHDSYDREKRWKHCVQALESLMTTSRPSTHGEQELRLRLTEIAFRLSRLPPALRQALNLVGANGYSYNDAAKVAGCPIGTMKSRVARARARVWEKGSHGAPRLGAAILHAPDFAHLDKAA